jgi:nitrous oxide reductase
MAEMSRRKFLQHGSLGVAAAAALATVPNAARTALAPSSSRGAAASTAGAATDAELGTSGPVMVHLADARTGEIRLYVGERELTRHDPALAAAIARAARS